MVINRRAAVPACGALVNIGAVGRVILLFGSKKNKHIEFRFVEIGPKLRELGNIHTLDFNITEFSQFIPIPEF
jgi:hypothetical protein